MRITIAAIGKCKSGAPEQQLVNKYLRQLPWDVRILELESKDRLPVDRRKAQEADALLKATGSCHLHIALDERGCHLESEALAARFGDWQTHGQSHIGICIGGADGLDEAVTSTAALQLSFGRLTWPHMLARTMLCEQLYRCHSILAGHPYHRS